MMTGHDIQRLRVVFRIGNSVKYISHLDLMRAWERALRRAKVGLAYSEGFNPRPKLVFAAALPVGFTASAEAVDILLERPMDLVRFAAAVKAQLPDGLELVSVTEVSTALPSLPNRLIAAEYRVVVKADESPARVQALLDQLLASDTLPRVRHRPEGAKKYDLRPLVHRLWLIGLQEEGMAIGMVLQADAQGTGRPDEVMAALDMAEKVRAIERVGLLFATS
jgi:radical SAM-linked protein